MKKRNLIDVLKIKLVMVSLLALITVLIASCESKSTEPISLKAEEQIDVTGDDIIPKIQRSAVVDKSRPGIDSELDQLQRNFNGNSEKETGAVKTQEESIAPFTDAIVKLELIIDWVQFPGGVK